MRKSGQRLVAFILFSSAVFAGVSQAQIVVFGASNVAGFGVSPLSAYPAQLEKILKEKGYDVRVANAGKSGDTTQGMLRRVDLAIPSGTRIVILDMRGGFYNNRKLGISREQGDADMSAIETRLTSRGIILIPASSAGIPTSYRQADGIHLTVEGHRLFAMRLLPEVINALSGMHSSRQ
jgi:acyl-CoA thioesterase-1